MTMFAALVSRIVFASTGGTLIEFRQQVLSRLQVPRLAPPATLRSSCTVHHARPILRRPVLPDSNRFRQAIPARLRSLRMRRIDTCVAV